MGKTTIEAFQCDRCGHAWIPRLKIDEDPTICPKCKSAYWNKPRRIDIAKGHLTNPRVKNPTIKGGKIKS